MPLFYQHTINDTAKIGVWHIDEDESFFLQKVPLQKEITHWHKRLQHLAGRYLLHELYPGFPYHLVEIADTRKPFLTNEEYHFSISHCGDYAAVIVSKNERVGIDIELITPKVEKVKHKFLNKEEYGLFNLQPPILNSEPPTSNLQPPTSNFELRTSNFELQLLTLLWCCKEAVFKWDGLGAIDFKKDINLISHEPGDKIINCDFIKEHSMSLQIRYYFFDGMCLAWVY